MPAGSSHDLLGFELDVLAEALRPPGFLEVHDRHFGVRQVVPDLLEVVAGAPGHRATRGLVERRLCEMVRLRGRTAPRSRAERPKPRCLRQVEDGWNTKPHEGGVCVGRNM